MSVKAMVDWAAIFDWDGVILDSARPHEESWRRLARELGRVLPTDHFTRGFGMKNEEIIPTLLGWSVDPVEVRRLSDRKEALYRVVIRETGVVLLPGARELLSALRAAAIPCGVGSSTPRLNITCVLDQLGLATAFDAIVAAEDVTRGKPDPGIFLLAARRLGLSPSRCVIFEDTPVGLQAARGAGMRAIAVATTHPARALAQADRVVQRLSELAVPELGAWMTAGGARD